ncbi:dihydrolipoamide dehydrogenase [Geoalkalibacter ferrihydriticus]|uniref:Dihydrolipoamide dehydrogenase n=2 Tax=Geoalkalibacter ferrihydriticus TaxID=392333 RepID=A0A0C2DVF5_9BACT|nr:dihydrolipoyl dehydrogenase [Geoalkalibacter ferrihydriticus]KIH77419.1 dihydrolipoamide dehydrogenase [Geoalkalibacter ferrihydriticus DSM 17813]SDM15728.1 dihydrolipoamide dehydrogenase [Geoalkalibacter ferrihydriticus]
MPEFYDVAIIGAGTAGLAALHEVKKSTENFVLINHGPYGTTCARVGCMPSKVLIETAAAFHRREVFEDFGIRGSAGLRMDIPSALARVRRLRDDFVRGTLKATETLGERNIAGQARFLEPDTLAVGDRRVRANKIIIATGSSPVVPDAWQRLGKRILTSDDLFEQIDLPSKMAVIGLGVIGVEMAQALARLGIHLHAFDRGGWIANLSDPQINDIAAACLREEFSVYLGASAELEPAGDGVRVRSGDVDMVVDKVLAALGRRPNLEHLGLEVLGVALDEKGLPPFDPLTMQIADLPIFIAGDVNQRAPLLHEAADDGHIAGRNATAEKPQCHARRTPLAIVFSDPNIAVVGRRFADLPEDQTLIGDVSFARSGRALAAATNRGGLRVYADKQSGCLLGAEICAPQGEHMAHLLALAIQQKLSVHDLLRLPFYHPVVEEGLRKALRRLAKQLPEAPASDLADCEAFGIDALD